MGSIRRVAIVGASGRLGKHFVEELLRTSHDITVLTRNDSNNILPEGVKPVVIDYEVESSLVDALRGQQFLVITLSSRAPADRHNKLVEAAAKAGVPYIMPNAYGPDIENDALAKEDIYSANCLKLTEQVKMAGPSFVAMCCSFWYEWGLLLGESCMGLDINNKRVTFFDDGETKVNTTTWRQCGRALAALLSLPETGSPGVSQWRNKALYISSFRISQRDMLDSVHRIMGTTDAEWHITYQPSAERYREGLAELQQGQPMGFAKAMYSRMFFPNGDSDFETSKGLANGVLKLPLEDLDEATKSVVTLVQSGLDPFI